MISDSRNTEEIRDERLVEFDTGSPDTMVMVDQAALLRKARKRVNLYLIVIGALVISGLSLYALYAFNVFPELGAFLARDNHIFYWMLLVGFFAELVAGSMGMGYGVICTTTLLILNVPPPVVSASIHSAESFTTAAGSLSHWKLRNVNKKMVKALALPAMLGAILGAVALTYFGEHYAKITKPFIALYMIYLGVNILKNAFTKKKRTRRRKLMSIKRLGLIGGFIDSFGGGGWGPLVTGTFLKNGRTPRYVVGSSTVVKFLLTVTSAVTFVFILGIKHWHIVAGLLIGGVITAPFSAMLTARLPVKKMFLIVGTLVILMSLVTIYRSIFL